MRKFLRHSLREGIITEDSNKCEYQVRYIDGPIFYKRKSKDEPWEFITSEDFALNAPHGKLVKWESQDQE